MSNLTFYYGPMGSSKTAQALMMEFNYKQKGFNTILLKPSIDTRDIENGKVIVKSRIGLKSPCKTYKKNDDIKKLIKFDCLDYNNSVVIVDEVQFSTKEHIDQLKEISIRVPVICYGLRTNFKSLLFEGSKRLFEIADHLIETKFVCKCGSKALINARFVNGKLANDGAEVALGCEESYESMCYECYIKLKKEAK